MATHRQKPQFLHELRDIEYNSPLCYHRLSGMIIASPDVSMPLHARRTASAIIFLFLAVGVFAQSSDSIYRHPRELVRKAVENEVNANNGSVRFMFRGTKATPRGSTTKIYVETKEATAGVVVAYDGKPLTPTQRMDEQNRNERFLKYPDELRKKKAQEREDAERTTRIIRALPDAFVFQEDGEVPGSSDVGHIGDPLVKLKFRPNPNYRPPSHVEEVLTGMEGDLLVDAKHYRIASIDGTLFREVGFGWGILGHLDKGGHFLVHQADVGENTWEISRMTLKFTGKILFFKNLSIDSTEVYSDFRQVSPDLTFAQALELIKKQDVSSENPLVSKSAGR